MTTQMTNLDELLKEVVTRRQQAEAAEAAARDKKIRANEEAAKEALREALENELSIDLVAALGITLHIVKADVQSAEAAALFKDELGDVRYTIKFNGIVRSPIQKHWHVNPDPLTRQYVNNQNRWMADFTCDVGALRDQLLFHIALTRETYNSLVEAEAETKRQQVEANLERARQRQQEREAEAQVRREAEAKQARIAAKIDAAREAAKESLWRWPEGMTLTLYQLTWTKGGAWDIDSEHLEFDYERGWTLTDSLDEHGYIEVLAPYSQQPRAIKLNLYSHKPIWERLTITSVADLPPMLREDAAFAVEGIIKEYDWRSEQSDFREREGEMTTFMLPDGVVPVKWIRDLADSIAGREPVAVLAFHSDY